MDFKELVIGFVVFALFALALINFVSVSQTNNNAPVNINSNPTINATLVNLNNQINSTAQNANSSYSNFHNQQGVLGTADIIFTAVPEFLKRVASSITGVYNITFGFLFESLGIPSVVGGIFLTILFISFVVGIWFIIRGVIQP